MAFTIPPVAEGIRNPSDLYNGWYGDVGPLPWSEAEFHDRLAWLGEQAGVGPLKVQYATPVTEGPDPRPAPTVANLAMDNGTYCDIVCRDIRNATEACYATLYQTKNKQPAPQIKPYPGFAVRNPSSASPVGPAWPEHPWKGRAMFKVADGDTLPEGANWEQSDGVYVKRRFVVIPGSGPFGTGAKTALAWERVYSR